MQSPEDRERWCRAVLQKHDWTPTTKQQQQQQQVGGRSSSSNANARPPSRNSPSPALLLDPIAFAVGGSNTRATSPPLPPLASAGRGNGGGGLIVVHNGDTASAIPGASTHFISEAKRFSPHVGGASNRAQQLRRMRISAPLVISKQQSSSNSVPPPLGQRQTKSGGAAIVSPIVARLRQAEERQKSVTASCSLFVSPLRLLPGPSSPPLSDVARAAAAAATPPPGLAAATRLKSSFDAHRADIRRQHLHQRMSPLPADSISMHQISAFHHLVDGKSHDNNSGNRQSVPHFMQPLTEAQRQHDLHEEYLMSRPLPTTPFAAVTFLPCRGRVVQPAPGQVEWSRCFQEKPHSRAVERIVSTSMAKRMELLRLAHQELNEELQGNHHHRHHDHHLNHNYQRHIPGVLQYEQQQHQQQQQPLAVHPVVSQESLMAHQNQQQG